MRRKLQKAKVRLRRALKDRSASVRIAAAETLYFLGDERKALSVLGAALMVKQLAVQLHAANVDIIGEGARPLLPQMKAAIGGAKASVLYPWAAPGLAPCDQHLGRSLEIDGRAHRALTTKRPPIKAVFFFGGVNGSLRFLFRQQLNIFGPGFLGCANKFNRLAQ